MQSKKSLFKVKMGATKRASKSVLGSRRSGFSPSQSQPKLLWTLNMYTSDAHDGSPVPHRDSEITSSNKGRIQVCTCEH